MLSNSYYVHTVYTKAERLAQLANNTKDYIKELAFDNIVDYLVLINYLEKNNVKEEHYAMIFDILGLSDSDREFIETSLKKVQGEEFTLRFEQPYYTYDTTNIFTGPCTCDIDQCCSRCYNK